jgi:hypothetical protein
MKIRFDAAEWKRARANYRQTRQSLFDAEQSIVSAAWRLIVLLAQTIHVLPAWVNCWKIRPSARASGYLTDSTALLREVREERSSRGIGKVQG